MLAAQKLAEWYQHHLVILRSQLYGSWTHRSLVDAIQTMMPTRIRITFLYRVACALTLETPASHVILYGGLASHRMRIATGSASPAKDKETATFAMVTMTGSQVSARAAGNQTYQIRVVTDHSVVGILATLAVWVLMATLVDVPSTSTMLAATQKTFAPRALCQ